MNNDYVVVIKSQRPLAQIKLLVAEAFDGYNDFEVIRVDIITDV